MQITRKTYLTRNEKVVDFIIGIGGWCLLNLVLWGVCSVSSMALGSVKGVEDILLNIFMLGMNFLPIIINIVLLIFFGITRHWIALGALAAFSFSLLIVVCLAAACFAMLAGFEGL